MTAQLEQFIGAGTLPSGHSDIEPIPQQGVVASNEAALSAISVNPSTGAITFTLSGATPIWIQHSTGLRVPYRFFGGTWTLTPTTLPVAGQYRAYGINFVENGTTELSSGGAGGGDQATAALALSAVNAYPLNDRIRAGDIAILNTAGSYSLAATRDRRPWANGFFCRQYRPSTSADITLVGVAALQAIDLATPLQMRVETYTGQLECRLRGVVGDSAAGNADFGLLVDGAQQTDVPFYRQSMTSGGNQAIDLSWLVTSLAPGSHLIAPAWANPNGGTTLTFRSSTAPYKGIAFEVREITRPNANNGTA